MTTHQGKTFANLLAAYVRYKMESVNRGAILVRCTSDDSVVAAVFGNDYYLTETRTRHEVELVQQRLRESAMEELGFGLSHDGRSWALLVQADSGGFKTDVGRAFHMELLRVSLEDMVEQAASRSGNEMGQGR